MKVTYPYVKVNINFNTDQSQTGLIPQTGFDIIEIAFNMQNKTKRLIDTIVSYVFVTDGNGLQVTDSLTVNQNLEMLAHLKMHTNKGSQSNIYFEKKTFILKILTQENPSIE